MTNDQRPGKEDKELERALRATFAAHADAVDHGPTWNGPEADGERGQGTGATVITSRRTAGPRHRWRTPLLAAAAVVAVALVASAVVTGGFGAGTNAATGGGAASVTVPITCGFTSVGNASGTAIGNGTGESHTQTTERSSSSSDGCTSPGSVHLSFVDGTPPEAGLAWTLWLGGAKTSASARDVRADGTPPSYLSFGGAIYDGSRYMWGAVGPDVAQVQIQALRAAGPGAGESEFSPSSASWTIGPGHGTKFSLPGQDDVVWTDLGYGWHAFALRPPLDTQQLDITTLASDGHAFVTRSFRFSDGSPDGSELPPQTPAVTTGLSPRDTAGTASKSGSATETALPTACPSTRETGTAAIPDSVRSMGGEWFGHDDLWVNAPRTAPAAGTKFWSVTLDDHGNFTDSKGAPALTAQLLGSAQTAEMAGTDYSSANVGGDTVYFWPTTVGFPHRGTWLITETVHDTTLRFCITAG